MESETEKTLDQRSWEDSQMNEGHFWRVQSKQANTEQQSRNSYYQSYLFPDFFDQADFTELTLIDVGSGPEGILHVLEAKRKIAVDPLMDLFGEIGYNVQANDVEAVALSAEDLWKLSCSADIVFCLNALDHMRNLPTAAKQIIELIRPGGFLILCVDLRPPRLVDAYHKIPLLEADVRFWFRSLRNESLRLVPHQKPNPIIQFVAVYQKP